MSGLESFVAIIGGLLMILSVVNAVREYVQSVKRAGRKDLLPKVKAKRAMLLVLHTTVLVGLALGLWRLGTGSLPVDDGVDVLFGVVGVLAVLYVILSIGSVKDDFQARSGEIKGALEELDEQQSKELTGGFLEKIGEGAGQEELQKYLKNEEGRMKSARDRLLQRLAGE